jgi:phage-related protein
MTPENQSKPIRLAPKLKVKFFRQKASGTEPVREWLKQLPDYERKQIGEDIKAVQFGWPLGLPLVDHIEGDVWEVRTKLPNRIARVLFALEGDSMVLLHGFIKKDQKTPKTDKKTALDRLKLLKSP